MKFDFSGKSSDLPRVPNYLGGRDRRSVTIWVLGGGFLLLIASNFTSFSNFARAILPGRNSKVDTRVPLDAYREPLPHGAIQMLPTADEVAEAPPPTADPQPTTNPQPSTEAAPAVAPNTKENPAPPWTVNMPPPLPAEQPKMPAHGKYFSGVNVPLLSNIQNEAPFRQKENEVWYHLFDVVNKVTPDQLKKESTPIDDFATLYGQSNFYRGQAIAMPGIAKWYMEVKSDPPDNAAGIAKYYQIGFQTNPREDNPIVVFVIDLPENLPRGKADPEYPSRFLLKPGVPFVFEGIFFKNLAYPAGDGEFRYMPALVAKTIRLDAAAAATEPPTNPMVYVLALLGLGLLMVLVMYFLSVKQKKIKFVIPSTNQPFSNPETVFPDLQVDDTDPKKPWPALPADE